MLLFASAKANIIFDNPGTLFLLFACSWLLLYKKRISVNRPFLVFLSFFLVYCLGYLFKFGTLNVTASLRFFMNITFAYSVIRLSGANFFRNTEEIVYKLALLSVGLYALQLAAPDLTFGLNSLLADLLPFMKPYWSEFEAYSNSILFTFNPVNHPYRNSGFMWEPGAFGAVLGVVLLLNLIRNQFVLTRRAVFFVAVMLTTVSTTAYLVIGVLLFMYLLNKGRIASLLAPALLVPLALLVWQLDFVGDKIEHQYETRDEALKNEKKYFQLGFKNRSLGRFGSLLVDYKDLTNNPVLGTGFQYEERTQGKLITYAKTNGLSDYMVKFGLLGLVLFIINLYRSFKRLQQEHPYKGVYVVPVLLMLIGFSNPVLFLPLFLSLQVYYMAR